MFCNLVYFNQILIPILNKFSNLLCAFIEYFQCLAYHQCNFLTPRIGPCGKVRFNPNLNIWKMCEVYLDNHKMTRMMISVSSTYRNQTLCRRGQHGPDYVHYRFFRYLITTEDLNTYACVVFYQGYS